MKIKEYITLAFLFMQVFTYGGEYDEAKLKAHWESNKADEIEGIYSVKQTQSLNGDVRSFIYRNNFFILKKSNMYIIGEVGGKIMGTLVSNYLMEQFTLEFDIANWCCPDDPQISRVYLKKWSDTEIKSELIKVILGGEQPYFFKIELTLVYKPQIKEDIQENISGTGFAISNDGIVVTNFHVVSSAKSIKIKGINSNFSIAYNATVLVSDPKNDLVLLKIDDLKFKLQEQVPFAIKTNLSEVGENIFTLGYPLRATMGDEIKLTNGIISSKTGFQGDISTYQISAPAQPGNSGGPLFDYFGNIIGVVNAKHNDADNVTYAIKATYLKNLIDLLPAKIISKNVNLINTKSLSILAESYKKYTYIIEVTK